jgi:hypothetical protein
MSVMIGGGGGGGGWNNKTKQQHNEKTQKIIYNKVVVVVSYTNKQTQTIEPSGQGLPLLLSFFDLPPPCWIPFFSSPFAIIVFEDFFVSNRSYSLIQVVVLNKMLCLLFLLCCMCCVVFLPLLFHWSQFLSRAIEVTIVTVLCMLA